MNLGWGFGVSNQPMNNVLWSTCSESHCAAPRPCETELYMSHIISSLCTEMASSACQPPCSNGWLLHPRTMRDEWWQGPTGFHRDLIKCEGPCGCSLTERRFNRTAQERLIHQPASNQRALGYSRQWWKARWLAQWRWKWLCAHEHVCANVRMHKMYTR